MSGEPLKNSHGDEVHVGDKGGRRAGHQIATIFETVSRAEMESPDCLGRRASLLGWEGGFG
jgi:hypothetical protein